MVKARTEKNASSAKIGFGAKLWLAAVPIGAGAAQVILAAHYFGTKLNKTARFRFA